MGSRSWTFLNFERVLAFLAATRGTPPRSAASCAISQLLGVEHRRAASGVVSEGFGREIAQRLLRGFELVVPVLFVPELCEEPVPDAILFIGRQCCQFSN